MKITLGSRGSPLALAQARSIAQLLHAQDPSLEIQIKPIKTKGDKILDVPIRQVGDKGLFVKELEIALINKEIDFAIHSVKDLPAEIPEALCLAAFPAREDPSDVLVTRENLAWEKVPQGAILGTSALRRQSQVLHHRPDLRIKMLRGNVETRLRKLDDGEYFGVIVANAGLRRLGIDRGTLIPPTILLPAPGQGALALEARKADQLLLETARKINDIETSLCMTAERSFLVKMEGGCSIPLGALALHERETLILKGFLGSPDGRNAIYEEIHRPDNHPEALGQELADRILELGQDILKRLQMPAGNP